MAKKWGKGDFWGIDSDYDPDWILTESQLQLREKIIDLCRRKIRPHAIHCDKTYAFPRETINAMAELGLLGLIIPKEFGGLGENHAGCVMVVETIARYGCPSTAMVYTMHLAACATLLLRYHNSSKIKDLFRRLDKEQLLGSLAYSDPATGGHFWFPLSSKVQQLDEDTIKILKFSSWCTSAGYADFYCFQTVSPNFEGDYSNLSCFLAYKDEIRASTDDWSALGMHGNQSGPLIVEGTFSLDRMIGPIGDGRRSNDECVDPYFLLCSSACWNGISMACMDLAKKHVTRKSHADKGIRVCDYPTIQDYFGEGVCDTNAIRLETYSVAQGMDKETIDNNWADHATDLDFMPRAKFLHWLWQLKFSASKNVSYIGEKMLHACGGTGYKTDLGLERLIRDGKAAWVMGPSNEVLRQFVGQTCLLGLSTIDFWEKNCNERSLHHELGKLSLESRKALGKKILFEAEMEEQGTNSRHPYQETDFENPFNTKPPVYVDKKLKTADGKLHGPGLSPDKWTTLSLTSRTDVTEYMSSFVFALPKSTDHTGCLPGQYVMVRVTVKGKEQIRYFSPVSTPQNLGLIELVLRYETQGLLSQHFRLLKPGDKVEMKGPCGGFEYESNKLEVLTLLASGGGITPGMQLIRGIMADKTDKTEVHLLYYSDNCNEILYHKELEKYAATDKRLKIFYTLGETPEDWDEEEGFIDTQMIEKHVVKPNTRKQKILMCGGPTMSIACLHSLRVLEYPSSDIFIYGQFGTEQVKTVYGRYVELSGHTCDTAV